MRIPLEIQEQFLRGSGGGKGKGEAPDNLRSQSSLSLEIAVCEGTVEGYASQEDLEKNLYLDETPVRNDDGTLNHENVTVVFVPGTQTQGELPGFTGKNQTDVDVNSTLKKDRGPVVRFIQDDRASLLRITLQFAGLVNTSGRRAEGSTVTHTVTIVDSIGSILTRDVNDAPGPYTWETTGKSTSLYEVDREFTLSGNSPYRVTIERVTPDSTSSGLRNDGVWSRYTLVNFDRLRHPFTAKLGIQISSSDFSTIPLIGLRGKWLKCSIPHNYDPIARTYTGIFNGSFTASKVWTNNPAYVLREVLNNRRFGCGDAIEGFAHNDYALYRIGQYCDESVSDGFGGTQPRYVINGLQSEAINADEFISKMLEICNSLWFYANSKLEYIQDRPRDILRTYTEANVLEGVSGGLVGDPCFNYSGVAREAIHTACKVRYRNKDNYHKEDYVYFSDEGQIAKYGYNLLDVDAPWCDSFGQAMRMARSKILTEKYDRRSIEFKLFNEGLLEYPGTLVAIADPARQGRRVGGRLKAVNGTRNQVTLDAPVLLENGKTYLWYCLGASQEFNVSIQTTSPWLVTGTGFSLSLLGARVGSARVTQVLSGTELTLSGDPGVTSGLVEFQFDMLAIARQVTTAPGTTDTLTLSTPLPFTPQVGTTWVLSDNDKPLPTYQVTSVAKSTSREGVFYSVRALESNQDKYAEIEDLGDSGQTLDRTVRPPDPKIDQVSVIESGSQLIIAWTLQRIIQNGEIVSNEANHTGFLVRYRRNQDNWILLPPTRARSLSVDITQDGDYYAQVAVRNYRGTPLWSPIIGESGPVLGDPTLTTSTVTLNTGLTTIVPAVPNRKILLASIDAVSPNTGYVQFASGTSVRGDRLNLASNVPEQLTNTSGIFITSLGEALAIDSTIDNVTFTFGWRATV